MPGYGYSGDRRQAVLARLLIAAIIALAACIGYFTQTAENPVTGETQRVAMSESEEIALGLHARPVLIQQHGGLHPSAQARRHVQEVGGRLLAHLERNLAAKGRRNPYPFEFHLLADPRTINAFALPGGQVFITSGLYQRLETEGELAGVLGHEIGHVLSRHGAQQLAKQRLTQGLAGAAGVAGGDVQSARLAQAVGQVVAMKYGRDAELESDRWGVRLMAWAGYDPRAMLGVMRILDEASGAGGPPEMLSTHPKPANRAAYIQDVLQKEFPSGLPPGLRP